MGLVAPKDLDQQQWYLELQRPCRRPGLANARAAAREGANDKLEAAREQREEYMIARGKVTGILRYVDTEDGWVWLRRGQLGHHPGLYPIRRESEGHVPAGKGRRGMASPAAVVRALLQYCHKSNKAWQEQMV